MWGARRRRLASTVLTYPVDVLVRRESVSRRNFSLERPGGPHQQSNDERAANQAHATMYSFFKAKMPPKADACEDSTTWHKNGDESKDCAWVAEWAPRCQVKGADKSLASEHCTCACQ